MTAEEIVTAIEEEVKDIATSEGLSPQDANDLLIKELRKNLISALIYPRSYRSMLTIRFRK